VPSRSEPPSELTAFHESSVRLGMTRIFEDPQANKLLSITFLNVPLVCQVAKLLSLPENTCVDRIPEAWVIKLCVPVCLDWLS